MPDVRLVTPTGGRPEAIALLASYLNAQTYKGMVIWHIIDDCDPATPVPQMREGIVVEYTRPEWRWEPGMNTQCPSLYRVLKWIPDSALVLIAEDDDLYRPQYIETMVNALKTADLVGEGGARYYNVATRRGRLLPSQHHASLTATGCTGKALALLREICCAGSRRIDMDLWRMFEGKKAILPPLNVVGIKGMPGRGGIGVGHRETFGDPDPDGELLRHWAGDLADNYLR